MGDMDNVDLSNPDFHGFLTKRSQWLKDWRQRYFVLKGILQFHQEKIFTHYYDDQLLNAIYYLVIYIYNLSILNVLIHVMHILQIHVIC